ncbi:MAG: co-chaperone GroES [Candidatus Lokiarchaeota archaeon]|nr:co-chaperone GroES [Candidatus Lokiarchaeota archaeon]
MRGGKELIIIGDRVLIAPDSGKDKTDSGLYLPQGIAEKEKVQSGYVVTVGPGYMIPNTESSEPWLNPNKEPQFVPLQVQEGDYAIFLRREAVEIEYDNKKYLIVPQAGILVVVRDEPSLDV